MKKLILITALLFGFCFLNAQVEVTHTKGDILKNFDLSTLSGTDTVIDFVIVPKEQITWSLGAVWVNVDTTGNIYPLVSDYSDRGFEYYVDSLGIEMSDTTGFGYIEDDMWNFRYGQIYIKLDDTVTAGRLWLYMNIVKP